MQMINPEVSVIQKIYKVILNRHELLSTRKNFAYTRLKQHHQFSTQHNSPIREELNNYNKGSSNDLECVKTKRYIQYLKGKIHGEENQERWVQIQKDHSQAAKKLSIKGSYLSTERSSAKKLQSKPILKKQKEDQHGEVTIQEDLNHISV